MRLLDFSFRAPEENLCGLEEVLLDAVESGDAKETLRLWESPVPFVVLGVAQSVRECVNEKVCQRDRISIQRRCSAGGCVLQGPGCLNFSLFLRRDLHSEIETIRGSYCFILERICVGLREQGLAASHKGISDIAVCGKKVSGNAQKRRRHSILHHGTLLYGGMNLEAMAKYLREPIDRPQYRGDRTHGGFVQPLALEAGELRRVVTDAFEVKGKARPPSSQEIEAARTLAQEKYSSSSWRYRR